MPDGMPGVPSFPEFQTVTLSTCLIECTSHGQHFGSLNGTIFATKFLRLRITWSE